MPASCRRPAGSALHSVCSADACRILAKTPHRYWQVFFIKAFCLFFLFERPWLRVSSAVLPVSDHSGQGVTRSPDLHCIAQKLKRTCALFILERMTRIPWKILHYISEIKPGRGQSGVHDPELRVETYHISRASLRHSLIHKGHFRWVYRVLLPSVTRQALSTQASAC